LMLIEIVDQQAQQIRQHTEQISQQTDLLAKLARRFAEFEESIDEQKSDMTIEQQNSLVPTPQSNNDHESFLSIVNRILRQQDTSKSEPLSIKSVSLLVPNKIDPIESNTEKTSTNNTNSSTENKEYTDVSWI
ncbi:unnamed protein product, partial [Adineta steineri]